MRLRRSLHQAKQAGSTEVTVLVEDLERLMLRNKQMDEKLAACMSKLSSVDYQELFGGMFEPD